MSRWNLAWLLGLSAACLLGLSITYSAPSRQSNLQRKHENLKLLVDVLEEVQQKYVKELDAEKMRELVENMINSGLERLDQHSSFINADEYKQFTKASRGKFGGVGIRIGLDRLGQVFVESPMVGTPAYEAGVMAGDLIVKIDGVSTENMPMKKVVELIQGEPGTKVTLSVLHENAKKPVDLEMKRAEIKIDSVLGDHRLHDKLQEWDFWIDPVSKIGYVRINSFQETTGEEMIRVVDALQKAGMRGLVMDLRNNPGGLLRAAVEVASLFLPEGKEIVNTKGRGGVREDVYQAKSPNAGFQQGNYPVAILINRYSASASEIVAAALQDHLRAIIVGERSYGKGSVQNVIALEGGQSALKLTTASYWRPSGRNIHRFPDSKEQDEWGVKPDDGFEVKLSDDERIEYFRWRRDRDIVRRPGEPQQEPEAEKEKEKDKDKKKEPFRDKVLDKALEYIRGEMQKRDKGAQAPPAQAPLDLELRRTLTTPVEAFLVPRMQPHRPFAIQMRNDTVRV
ncbi:MAG: S41 family peptidase [Gemmataceae bacterium]|nr:S41 family peptidase [Gemmataceae bacterium]MCI0739112.1 S41 family peptidase [Gemmataceae bacterium]